MHTAHIYAYMCVHGYTNIHMIHTYTYYIHMYKHIYTHVHAH